MACKLISQIHILSYRRVPLLAPPSILFAPANTKRQQPFDMKPEFNDIHKQP